MTQLHARGVYHDLSKPPFLAILRIVCLAAKKVPIGAPFWRSEYLTTPQFLRKILKKFFLQNWRKNRAGSQLRPPQKWPLPKIDPNPKNLSHPNEVTTNLVVTSLESKKSTFVDFSTFWPKMTILTLKNDQGTGLVAL